MSSQSGTVSCTTACWGIAAVVGLLAMIFLITVADWALFAGFLTGLILALVLGLVLIFTVCGDSQQPNAGSDRAPAPPATPAAPPAPPAGTATAEPSAPAPAEQDHPPPEPTPAERVPEPATTGEARPAGLAAARGGLPDDLKKIKGVGPKLERLLNGMGIYHFDQVASWTPEEVAWVDDNLQGFRGRVTRDGWVAQAALLAAGGETEFSRKVDEGDVY